MKGRLAILAVSVILWAWVWPVRAQPGGELADFDAFVRQQLALCTVPGVSASIVKDGQVVLARGDGLRDVQRQLPMTSDAMQSIASGTKSFAVASLATLVRNGKLE